MPEQEEKSERIFPVLNRRTPVLDRIRGNGRGSSIAFKLGQRSAESVMSDDEDGLTTLAENSAEEFKAGAADALGVNVENINDSVANDVARLIAGLDEKDILNTDALIQLGLEEDDSEETTETSDEEENESEDGDRDGEEEGELF